MTEDELSSEPTVEGQNPKDLLAASLEPTGTAPTPTTWEPPLPEELEPLMPGYQITGVLGRGGMGAVYRGVQENLDREVAIKLLPPELGADPEFEARFKREAQSMAKLNHPNIVQIYDYGQTKEKHHFFVMEFVDGTDLHEFIRSGSLDSEGALNAISQICDALQYAHDEGYVHRDIKPANIFLNSKGIIKVGDFGLAKLVEGAGNQSSATEHMGLTMTGVAMGTPHYIAPEQMEADGSVDHRADIYSMGVMFYEMLTGEIPRGAVKPPSQKDKGKLLDVRIDGVVFRAMESDPGERYQRAAELQSDVDTIRTTPIQVGPDDEPRARSQPRPKPKKKKGEMLIASLVALGSVMVIGGTIFFLGGNQPETPSASNNSGDSSTKEPTNTKRVSGLELSLPLPKRPKIGGELVAVEVRPNSEINSWLELIPLGLKDVVQISIHKHGGDTPRPDEIPGHGLALRADGSVVAWGVYREDVTDASIGPLVTVPPDLKNVASVHTAADFSAALLEDGTIRMWGNDIQGRHDIPKELTQAAALALGGKRSIALDRKGRVHQWGWYEGYKTNEIDFTPPSVFEHDPPMRIFCDFNSNLAITRSGNVQVWGKSTTPWTPPSPIADLTFRGGLALAALDDSRLFAFSPGQSNSFQEAKSSPLSGIPHQVGHAFSYLISESRRNSYNFTLSQDGAWQFLSEISPDAQNGIRNCIQLEGWRTHVIGIRVPEDELQLAMQEREEIRQYRRPLSTESLSRLDGDLLGSQWVPDSGGARGQTASMTIASQRSLQLEKTYRVTPDSLKITPKSPRTFELHWESGIAETGIVSPDGTRLSFSGNWGDWINIAKLSSRPGRIRVFGTRKLGDQIVPVPQPPTDLPENFVDLRFSSHAWSGVTADGRLIWGALAPGIEGKDGINNASLENDAVQRQAALLDDGTAAFWADQAKWAPKNLRSVVSLATSIDSGAALHEDGTATIWANPEILKGETLFQPSPQWLGDAIKVTAAGNTFAFLRQDGSVAFCDVDGERPSPVDQPLSDIFGVSDSRPEFAGLGQDGSVYFCARRRSGWQFWNMNRDLPRAKKLRVGGSWGAVQDFAGKWHPFVILGTDDPNLDYAELFATIRGLEGVDELELSGWIDHGSAVWIEPAISNVESQHLVEIRGSLHGAGKIQRLDLDVSSEIDISKTARWNDFEDIAVGWPSWIALRSNGHAIGWNMNASTGRKFIEHSGIQKVHASLSGGLYLVTKDGLVIRWSGGSHTPIPPKEPINAVNVSTGSFHGLIHHRDGSASVWGKIYDDGKWTSPSEDVLNSVSQIAAAQFAAAVIDGSGKLHVWRDEGACHIPSEILQNCQQIEGTGQRSFFAFTKEGELYQYTATVEENDSALKWLGRYDPKSVIRVGHRAILVKEPAQRWKLLQTAFDESSDDIFDLQRAVEALPQSSLPVACSFNSPGSGNLPFAKASFLLWIEPDSQNSASNQKVR